MRYSNERKGGISPVGNFLLLLCKLFMLYSVRNLIFLIFRKLSPREEGWGKKAFPFTWIVAFALANRPPRVDWSPVPPEYWSAAKQSGGKPGRIRNGGSLGNPAGPANSCCQGSPSTRACTWSLGAGKIYTRASMCGSV